MKIGLEFYSLERFEIRCAVENIKSRAITERLGFMNEGTIHRAEKVCDHWYDHAVYGKLVTKGDADQGLDSIGASSADPDRVS